MDDVTADLSISIVIYKSPAEQIAATLRALEEAVLEMQSGLKVAVFVIDNNPAASSRLDFPMAVGVRLDIDYLHGHGNVGFGAGHDLVLNSIGGYHLILNPDVEVARDALKEALDFMLRHPECGLLSPRATWDDGSRQYLCKRYPSILDLLLRGFAPAAIRRIFADRLGRYEMRGETEAEVVWNPPIVSGCFMLLRRDVLQQLGGFDPAYFLYFEDFDLSLRAARVTRLAYVPGVRIVHHGGHASRKGLRHVVMFARSALRFFRTHGWRFA